MPGDKPPPLPPRQPYPKAKSDPPLDMTPAPDARRMRSTPPSGSLLLAREVERLNEDPRDEVIRELRQTIVLYRERLTTLQTAMPNTSPSLTPEAPKSRAQVVGKVGFNLGKYGTHIVGILALADVVVGLWLPEYKGPLASLKSLLGIP